MIIYQFIIKLEKTLTNNVCLILLLFNFVHRGFANAIFATKNAIFYQCEQIQNRSMQYAATSISLLFLECMNGTYGYDCMKCSKTCKNENCNKFTENGICIEGCEVGYKGETCEQGK